MSASNGPHLASIVIKLFNVEELLSFPRYFLPLIVMIHSVKSILLFNFANSLLPLIKDFAGLSTEDDRISCSGDL